VIRDEAGRRVEGGFRNYWFRQRIGDLIIMECYAKNFKEMADRLSVLNHMNGVDSYIYMVPSRLLFSENEIPEI
jgi:hypothetical protein